MISDLNQDLPQMIRVLAFVLGFGFGFIGAMLVGYKVMDLIRLFRRRRTQRKRNRCN